MKQSLFAFALVLSAMLFSCNQNVVFEKNLDIKNESWDYSQAQTFKVNIEDTTSRYNIYINIRHTFHFEWRNLWIQIDTEFPDGKKLSKRVNLPLSEADGKWFGECSGNSCFIQIPLQENAIFPVTGNYTFTIRQDMRVNPLQNIRNVGLKVEKIKQ